MKNAYQKLIYLNLILILIACSSAQTGSINGNLVGYNLSQPSQRYLLPYELQEVSGLAFVNDSTIAMVQDEEGIIYLYNLNQKKVIRKLAFDQSGDFEGVEVVGDKVFVVLSNGNIIQFGINSKEKPLKVKTELSYKNNVEGLGYDPEKDLLLIACKESPNTKGTDYKGRAIYFYNIKEQKLLKNPIIVTKKDITKYIDQESLEMKFNEFKPSAISVHPLTSDFVILAHIGKVLVGVDSEGKISFAQKLKGSNFYQPEGICFSPNGDMFIASEGGKDRGVLVRFDYQKK